MEDILFFMIVMGEGYYKKKNYCVMVLIGI